MSKIVEFKASNFVGYNGKPIMVDEDFVPYLKTMNDIAVKSNMQVIVTSSFRKDTNVKGAIVKPATMSNHLVGHAIDFNLMDLTTKEYFNSKKMADDKGKDEEFCKEVSAKTGMRWGDAFQVKDSVHMDDSLNLLNPRLYSEKYNLFHS